MSVKAYLTKIKYYSLKTVNRSSGLFFFEAFVALVFVHSAPEERAFDTSDYVIPKRFPGLHRARSRLST
jgi:hypothetical protein